MNHNFFKLVLITAICLAFGAGETFAQCGADGTQPCGAIPAKPTAVTRTATKAAAKPASRKSPANTVRLKPSPKFIPRVPEIEMVGIPAGSFMMGSDNGDDDEKPVHKVFISRPFLMGKYEVTQAQWRAVMGNNPSEFPNCGDDCPVASVSWDNVQEFIRRLNKRRSGDKYRLPTEAEWEYAARAGTTGDYYGNLDSIAWYQSNSGDEPHPVGRKTPNAFGLYDMSGNVWEWCQDQADNYSGETVTDPLIVSPGSGYVIRGGGWLYFARNLRSSSRGASSSSSISYNFVGFRLVRPRQAE